MIKSFKKYLTTGSVDWWNLPQMKLVWYFLFFLRNLLERYALWTVLWLTFWRGAIILSRFDIVRFHCHATKKYIGNRPVEEAKKMKCYKRLVYKQFVSGQSQVFVAHKDQSYLPKRFTHLCRALYAWRRAHKHIFRGGWQRGLEPSLHDHPS